ncbi:MAG: transglycosylase SLT domain-containing protein [Methylotenera sp.]
MRLINYVIFLFLIAATGSCLAEEKLFGDESIESCLHGAVDAQLKNGPQAVKPVQVTVMCLCMNAELNRTVTKSDITEAAKGNVDALETKNRAVMLKCSNYISKKEILNNEEISSNWVLHMSSRLETQLPDKLYREDFLRSVYSEANKASLDPSLIMGLIEVASDFKKYALSANGSKGYMQVSPSWVEKIGTPESNPFHLLLNLRMGCTILRHYLEVSNGDVNMALVAYAKSNIYINDDSNTQSIKFAKAVTTIQKRRWL